MIESNFPSSPIASTFAHHPTHSAHDLPRFSQKLPQSSALAFFLSLSLSLFNCQSTSTNETTESESRPNVVLILTDDQGWGDLSLHGNPYLETPHIDRLAQNGLQHTNFYVNPLCAPTRASLLTGRYNLRTGTRWVSNGLENMRPEEFTLAEMFQSADYATGLLRQVAQRGTLSVSSQSAGLRRIYRLLRRALEQLL